MLNGKKEFNNLNKSLIGTYFSAMTSTAGQCTSFLSVHRFVEKWNRPSRISRVLPINFHGSSCCLEHPP